MIEYRRAVKEIQLAGAELQKRECGRKVDTDIFYSNFPLYSWFRLGVSPKVAVATLRRISSTHLRCFCSHPDKRRNQGDIASPT